MASTAAYLVNSELYTRSGRDSCWSDYVHCRDTISGTGALGCDARTGVWSARLAAGAGPVPNGKSESNGIPTAFKDTRPYGRRDIGRVNRVTIKLLGQSG